MSKPLDRLALLETFVRIADAGSISAAARDLGLSQPSVSRQLAELEARFRVQLMRRTTHSLALTAAGAALLADARRLLDDWDVLEEQHIESGEALRGKLKIVAPIALGQLHLVDIAVQFQQQYPLILLSWQLQDEPIRFAEVGCDCWIKIGAVPNDSLLIEPLGQVERLVVASPALLQTHRPPKTPKALATLPCVALSPFEGGQIPLTHSTGKTVVISPTVKMVTNNIFALRQATLAGVGISVLPRWFITNELEDQQLIDLLPGWRAPQLTIHMASRRDRHQPRRLRRFLDTIKAAVPQIPGIVQ